MKPLLAALGLVFVVGATLPGQADATAKHYRFNAFGGHHLKTWINLDGPCYRCDPETYMYEATLRTDPYHTPNRSVRKDHPRIHSIRMAVWKDMPGQRWDKKLKVRTWRDVRLGVTNVDSSGMSNFMIHGCGGVDDPIGTRYYTKVRIKRTKTSPAIWLRSAPRLHSTLRYPWNCQLTD